MWVFVHTKRRFQAEIGAGRVQNLCCEVFHLLPSALSVSTAYVYVWTAHSLHFTYFFKINFIIRFSSLSDPISILFEKSEIEILFASLVDLVAPRKIHSRPSWLRVHGGIHANETSARMWNELSVCGHWFAVHLHFRHELNHENGAVERARK